MPNRGRVTFRDMNLAVFERRATPHVLFQPRLEPWFAWQKRFNSANFAYNDTPLLEFYDEFALSMRYVDYYTEQPSPIVWSHSPELEMKREELSPGVFRVTAKTPFGDLTKVDEWTIDETWREVEFYCKGPHDFPALRWFLERTQIRFDAARFAQGAEFMGDRGWPQFYIPKSPYQALAQTWMGFEDFQYALIDDPAGIEETMETIDRMLDPLFEDLCTAEGVKIVNFGENLHAHLMSPGYFTRYLVPYYARRCKQLRAAGVHSHMHFDGYYKPFLGLLAGLPFDGIEALTPLPQGDAGLVETHEAIGDLIALDLIPAVLFLDTYSLDDLQACVKQIVSLFRPNLILGISDELPEAASGQQVIDKLRWTSDFARESAASG